MFKLFVRNKRAVAMAMSAMLVATAFTPSGCTINIDEGLVQQVVDWASEFEPPWQSEGEFEYSGSWGRPGPCGGDDGGGGCDGGA